MSGPSALGTLLVQRLDAALGTTLSQQANVVSGARPDAVTQPGHTERPDALRNEIPRDGRANVDRALENTRQQGQPGVDRAKLDARAAALLASRGLVSTAATPSAPTSLGQAARAILALLANYPGQSPVVQGREPLLSRAPQSLLGQAGNSPAGAQRSDASANNAGRTAAGANAPAGTASTAVDAAGRAMPVPGIAGQLTQALTQIVQNSGMFYEAHLNNLAFGKQTAAQLRQEPQAMAGRNTTTAPTPNPPNSPAIAATANTPAESAATARVEAATGIISSATGHAPTGQSSVPGVDPQTHLLVRQQLEVLANQTFAWRGEAWPEAPMEWEVSRHESPAPDQEGAESHTHWATKIKIELPQLGSVQAKITLSGQQLILHLVAPDSAGLLGDHTESLRERCSGQGLQLSQLSIARTGPGLAQEESSDDHTSTRA